MRVVFFIAELILGYEHYPVPVHRNALLRCTGKPTFAQEQDRQALFISGKIHLLSISNRPRWMLSDKFDSREQGERTDYTRV